MLSINTMRNNFDERYPLFEQIYVGFCAAIVRKDLALGERVPSIRNLSIELKVNTNTIQRAYNELEQDGIIYSQRGLGYFVKEEEALVNMLQEKMIKESVTRFLQEMKTLDLSNEVIIKKLQEQLEEENTNVDEASRD